MNPLRESESEYRVRIAEMHGELGIAADYEQACGMVLQLECPTLADAGMDVFGRPALLDGDALSAWRCMQQRAAVEGVTLQMVSAWRSAEYQKGIFRRKLDSGQALLDILKVNAAPGFSEHHTGRAIDIGTPGHEHLSEAFESSQAFGWLQEHAQAFGFLLSFPRDNPAGMLYEPWHWAYSPLLSPNVD